MEVTDFDLPPDLIAQDPPPARDGGRLLVLRGPTLDDRAVVDLPSLLEPGDLLVFNDSRVIPARCLLHRESGGAVEVLFLGVGPGPVEALVRPARRLQPGEVLSGPGDVRVVLRERYDDGRWVVEAAPSPEAVMGAVGHVPLPPYIRRADVAADRERYQTVYARQPGSAAAPTAGLHFTPALLEALRCRGVEVAWLTLHVGLGTFRPLREEDLSRGTLHPEPWSVPPETAEAVRATRSRGGRVVAVGTTAVRTLESATPEGASGPVPGAGTTRLFIRPGHRFRSVDALITNFHLPRSSLLMLVEAFAGRDRTRAAYAHAVTHRYRFYSYGDAMLVL